MPSVLFDGVISGEGSNDWPGAGTQVLYVAFDCTTLPDRAAPNQYGVADQWGRIGWWSFGDSIDIGDGTFEFWSDLHWWNFERNLYIPSPTTSTTGLVFADLATRIRWFVFPGGEGHLHVFG